jgi:hypothetical protein
MDNYERESERKEVIRQTELHADELAAAIRGLYDSYKRFCEIESRLSNAGYRVEKGDNLKIWKQI